MYAKKAFKREYIFLEKKKPRNIQEKMNTVK